MKNRGITLIALVITIIVLLILAGVTLSLTLGENGILQKARTAKIDSEIAREKEQILLAMNSSFGDDGKNAKVIDKNKMEQNLQATEGKDNVKLIADIEEDESFYVKFIKTNRYYEIDLDRNVTLIEVTGGEKQLTVKCIDSNKNVLATKTWIILKDNFSKTLPKVEGYLPEKEKLVDKITEDTTIEILYYYLIPESQMVFTGLTSSGAVATNVSQIASYMIGDNSNTNGNGLVSAPTNLSALKIPDTYNGKPVTKVGDNAFYGMNKIVILSTGNNITNIGARAFSGCTGIIKLIIENGLNSIGAYGFHNSCSNLKTLVYNNTTNVISILGLNWEEIQVNSENTAFKVVDNILYSKDGTKIVKVPTGKSGSFTIPEEVVEVGESAFENCSKITELNIGNNLTTIGKRGFSGCTGITKLIIGNGLNSIGAYGFYNSCTNLKTLVYNNTRNLISILGLNWEEIYVSESNTELKVQDNVLYSKDGTKIVRVSPGRTGSFTIPEEVVEVGESAFENCSKITELNIGNNLTTVGKRGFSGCTGITELLIKNKVNTIGGYGFYSCTNLKTVIIDSETIASKLLEQNACGFLVSSATTIYAKSTPGSYIIDNFNVVTSDKPGYTKYVKK